MVLIVNGGKVSRTTQEISAVPDLPSPLPAMGARGQAGAHLAGLGRGVASPRETRTGGGFYRRLIHGGKKGGLAAEPTRRVKGTTTLIVTDDHRLPLAVI